MTRQFSMRTVLRAMDKPLLRKLFEELGFETGHIPWNNLRGQCLVSLHSFVDELTRPEHDRLETIFRNVTMLANAEGMNVLKEAAGEIEEEGWTNLFQSDQNLYSKSLAAWMFHREIFEKALSLYQVSSLTWWRKRVDLPKITPEFTEEHRENLEDDLQTFFKEEQGRGFCCTVEMMEMRPGIFYFFAYPDDHIKNTLVHNHDNCLVHRIIRETFEVVFVYDRHEGSSELHAKLSRRLKAKLEQIFLDHILAMAPPAYEESPYDLSVLLDPGFTPVTEPQDRINVRVLKVTLEWTGKFGLTLDIKNGATILDAIEEYSLQEAFTLASQAKATHGKFRFEFYSEDGGKPKTVTFEIGVPFSNTLKSQHPDRAELIHKYLKKWGIEYDESVADVSSASRLHAAANLSISR